jgi:hypothetical protein
MPSLLSAWAQTTYAPIHVVPTILFLIAIDAAIVIRTQGLSSDPTRPNSIPTRPTRIAPLLQNWPCWSPRIGGATNQAEAVLARGPSLLPFSGMPSGASHFAFHYSQSPRARICPTNGMPWHTERFDAGVILSIAATNHPIVSISSFFFCKQANLLGRSLPPVRPGVVGECVKGAREAASTRSARCVCVCVCVCVRVRACERVRESGRERERERTDLSRVFVHRRASNKMSGSGGGLCPPPASLPPP